jgi:outer membrane protein OmpA-like peptidoglycan-associated protein
MKQIIAAMGLGILCTAALAQSGATAYYGTPEEARAALLQNKVPADPALAPADPSATPADASEADQGPAPRKSVKIKGRGLVIMNPGPEGGSSPVAPIVAVPAAVPTPAAAPPSAPTSQTTTLASNPRPAPAPVAAPAVAAPAWAPAAPAPSPATTMAPGTAVALPIQFGLNSSTISEQSMAFVDVIADLLRQNPGMRLSVEGHTDASGLSQRNDLLSFERAMSVYHTLVEKYGIPSNRLLPAGKGSSEPLNGANPLDPRNRRVQFRVLG